MSARPEVFLVPIDRDGNPLDFAGFLPAVTNEVFRATTELYEAVGFEEPWIGYLALAEGIAVGTCGFKSPPRDGRVEIGYLTFPEFEGRGIASAMAAALVTRARENDPAVMVAAQTLPGRNASHRVLEKLGFQHVETIDHPEDGPVWEWQLRTPDPREPSPAVRGGEEKGCLVPLPRASWSNLGELREVISCSEVDGGFAADLERIRDEQPELEEDPWNA